MRRRRAQTTRSSSDPDGRGVALDPVSLIGGFAIELVVVAVPMISLALLVYSSVCAVKEFE